MLLSPVGTLNKMPKHTDIFKKKWKKNQQKKNRRNIMGHRSVITASIFILGITLCDFFIYESLVIHTTHRFCSIFIAFFACAKERKRTEHTAKRKTQTEINIFRSTDMHQKRASTTYIAYKRRHTYHLKRRCRGAYISQNSKFHNEIVQTGSAWIVRCMCTLSLFLSLFWFFSFNRNQIILLYIFISAEVNGGKKINIKNQHC